ncbi:hypothetical protein BFP71_03295 [Roseivirga misakiensis]|uniref:Diphthamide synthase domain-containing protein n=1 Tax=Roseivirga misakiensis TaxID=1563681 RepID=A0A1E5T780_9BACT|nr:hypothetical protein BFP71_03295 [Roseivirga misakiensis]
MTNSGSFLCSWSGGKDSYLAYCKAIELGLSPRLLFNVLNEFGENSRSHGIPKDILYAQAACLKLPMEFIASTWTDYETKFITRLKELKAEYDIDHAVFGDIDIASHRAWEEKVSEAASLKPILPLWRQERLSLVYEMLEMGIEAMVVSCQTHLASSILGKVINRDLVTEFQRLGIDECGENGEYHTLVLDGPQHVRPLNIQTGHFIQHEHYSFIALEL